MFSRDEKGVTLVELVTVMVIMSILAAVAMPMYTVSVKRAREYELKRSLRQMRDAIDEYKRWVDNGWISKTTSSGYPENLDVLVSGATTTGVTPTAATAGAPVTKGATRSNPPGALPKTVSFLRKIPVDPMTGQAEWGLKSNEDVATESGISGGADVYDVYSQSEEYALDGTSYSDW